MSASEMFAKIVRAKILDEKTLERLRSQVEDPTKKVKPRAIVKYLLTKGYIDQQQSDDLLAGKELVPRLVTDDQFEEPEVPKNEYDTDDLTAVIGHMSDPVAEPEEEITDLGDEDELVELPDEVRAPPRETRMMDPDDLEDIEPEKTHSTKKSGQSPEKERKPSRKSQPERKPAVESPATAGFSSFDEPSSESFVSSSMDGPRKTYSGKLDTTDQWNTRWLWTGFAVLAALLVAVGVLWLGVLRVDADKLFGDAEQSFASGAYGDADNLFTEFAERFPTHDKAPLAKVRAVNARIRFSYHTEDYRTAYRVANENLPGVAEEPPFNDELRPDLGVMLPVIAQWYSTLALDPKNTVKQVEEKLEESKKVYADLIETRIYLTGSQRNTQRATELIASAENNNLMAQGILKKEEDYAAISAKIKQLTSEGKTDSAFGEFTRIVRTYPDLGARAELRETMRAVSKREIGLVTSSDLPVDLTPGALPSPVVGQVLTGSTVGSPVEAMVGEILPILVEGTVYGVDAGSGQLVWRHFAGLPTTIQPQWTNEDNRTSLIVCNEEKKLVQRLDAGTGNVVWTARIDQSLMSPKITSEALFVTTREGSIVKLNIESGERIAAAKLPRRAAVPCEVAEQSLKLFVAGEDSNLYVLNSETLACDFVYYIGHAPGSVRLAPIFWSGFVLVVVSDSESSYLLVLKNNEENGDWEQAQRIRLARGSISTEPSRLGRYMLFTSDNGEIRIMDMNPAEPESPIREFAAGTFDSRNSKIWSLASGSDLWIAGRGLVNFRIQRSAGQLETGKVPIIDGNDAFLCPIKKRDDVLFTVRRRSGSILVSVAALNSETMQQIWRTDFGGPPAGRPFVSGQSLAMVTAQGNMMKLGTGEIQAGAAAETAKASDIDEVFAFSRQVVFEDGSSANLGPVGFAYMLQADPGNNTLALRRLQAPSEQPACDPVAVGQDMLIPTLNGYLVRIDPKTGSYAGSPYQPPLSPGSVVNWNPPAKLGDDSIVIGNGQNKLMLIDASDRASLKLAAEIDINGQISSSIVGIGQSAFFVEQGEQGTKIVRADSTGTALQRQGEAELAGLITQDPIVAGELVLVSTEDGKLTAYDPSLAKKWSLTTDGDRVVSAENTGSQGTMLCFEKGQVQFVSSSGEVQQTIELGQPISRAPVLIDNQLMFTAADGTLLMVNGVTN